MKRKAQPINFECDERVQDALTSRNFSVRCEKHEEDGEESVDLIIYEVIGGDFWDEDPQATPAAVAAFLSENRGVPVNVRINSPGGLAYDGIVIYNALVGHGAKVTTTIEGMAASAASIIAMAGDTIRIHENATLMIHRAWGIVMGNSADMKDYAETLDRLDGQLAGTYAARTGLRIDTVTKLMIGESDGTSFDAAEAKAKGFADEIVPNKKKAKAQVGDRAECVLDDSGRYRRATKDDLCDESTMATLTSCWQNPRSGIWHQLPSSGGPDADGAIPFVLKRRDGKPMGDPIDTDAIASSVKNIAKREQAAAREREARTRKLRLMEIDGHASQTPTG